MSDTPNTITTLAKDGTQKKQLPMGQLAIGIFPGDKKGDPEVTALVRSTQRGLVRAIKTHITLSVERGEVWSMKAWDPVSRTKIIKHHATALGLMKLNLFAGVSIIAADTVADEDGNATGNPYFRRNKNRHIEYVKLRLFGVGRVANGNLTCIDYTLQFNLSVYFAQDLYSKWLGYGKDADVAKWGTLYDSESIPDDVAKNPQMKTVHLPGDVALVVDLKAREVVQCFQEHVGRQRKAAEIARTFAERNLLTRFLAVRSLPNDLTVPVVGWTQEDRDMADIGELIKRTQTGETDLGTEVVDAVIVNEEIETPDDAPADDMVDASDAEFSQTNDDDELPPFDDDGGTGAGDATPPPPDAVSDQVKDLRDKVRDAYAQLKPLEAKQIVASHKTTIQAVAKLENVGILNAILSELIAAQPTK